MQELRTRKEEESAKLFKRITQLEALQQEAENKVSSVDPRINTQLSLLKQSEDAILTLYEDNMRYESQIATLTTRLQILSNQTAGTIQKGDAQLAEQEATITSKKVPNSVSTHQFFFQFYTVRSKTWRKIKVT